eukprot:128032_1
MDRFGNKVLDLVFGLCLRHPKKIMALWIIGALSCAYWAQDLTQYCIFNYLPPDGTPSAEAFDKIGQYFPKFLFQDFELIVIGTNPGETVLSNETEALLMDINHTLWHDINHEYDILLSFSTFYDSVANVPSSSSVYPLFKQRFVSSDNSTMISFLSLNINGVNQDIISGFLDKLDDNLSSLKHKYSNYKMVSLTGPMTMWGQAMVEMESDMTTKDMMMMPFIFALIMYVVGSWKFIAVVGPILLMVIILSLSSFLPFAVYNVFEVNPMAPSIMLFLATALSVDYSMFLISRFTAEIRLGSSVQHAVREMIKYSAHVVVLSGMVLLIGYLGITYFPVSGMDTVGYGAVVTIFYSVVINVSYTASSILAFPTFFGTLEVVPRCCVRCYHKCCCKKQYNPLESALHIQQPPSNGASADVDKRLRCHENAQNCYFRMTQYTTRSPWKYVVPLVVYGAMSPVIYILFTRYTYSMDFTYFLPHDSPSIDAWNSMSDKFPPSILMPYYLLGVTNDPHDKDKEIWSDEFFNTFCYATDQLMTTFDIPSYHFHSVMFAPGITYNPSDHTHLNISDSQIMCFDQNLTARNNITYSTVNAIKYLYQNGTAVFNSSRINQYSALLDEYMTTMISNPSQTASIISFLVPFNPMLQTAVAPSRAMRSLVDDINKNESIANVTKFYLHNSLYWQIDSLDVTNQRFPWMLTIIIGGIFLMIGLMFKSLFLPLRLLFAVVIPITFVYGVCTGVYVLGWLDWLQWKSVASGEGIIWMAPCLTVTILMGLAMDYEIFLFSRVFEYRHKGYTTRAAIILAVANTGPIISSAGTVMAMAFGGMLLQNIVSSNQMGFLFVFGVLIDTFIVRPLLVPPILSLIDVLNWWPTQVPKHNLLNEYGKIE